MKRITRQRRLSDLAQVECPVGNRAKTTGYTTRLTNALATGFTAGFTLVELLVVIGIIAVLVGILLPVLSKARESAISIQCMSNLRQFAIADQMYVQTYGWHMPGWWNDPTKSPPGPSAFSSYNRNWAGIRDFRKALSLPILDGEPAPDPNFNPEVFRCYVTDKWFCKDAQRADLTAPPVDPVTHQNYYPIHYSYGMNVMGVDSPNVLPPGMSGGLGGSAGLSGGESPSYDVWDPRATQADPRVKTVNIDRIFHGFNPSQVKRASEKIHFADAMYFVINIYGCGGQGTGYPGWGGGSAVCNYNFTGERVKGDTVPMGAVNTQRSIAWRHKGGANVMFFDGHGEWMRKDLLYKTDASGKIIRNDAIWDVMN